MPAVEFPVFRQKDTDFLTAIRKIQEACQPGSDLRTSLSVADGAQVLDAPMSSLASNTAVQTILAADIVLIRQVTLYLDSGIQINARRDPDGIDRCTITFQNNTALDVLAPIIASAKLHFHTFDRMESVDRLLGPELTEFYHKREEGVLRLEELTERLVRQNSEYRRTVDQETTELRQRLQAENEIARTQLQTAYESKEADLKERERTFETRSRELDDRRSTHARRQIRKDLKEILASRGKDFSLTTGTTRKRLPIHILFILLVATPGVVFFRSFVDFAWGSIPMDWAHLVRLPLSGIGLAAALIFYLRWNDQWFRQHAEEEFRLKQLDLDIDRASWVVEMALEWKEEKGTAIPTELIDRLSRNLFVSEGNLDAVRHPAHDLASALLGASTGLNINIPGLGEAKLDRRGLKRFQKSAEEVGDA